MKKSMTVLLFTIVIKVTLSQTPSVVGAWHWSDSTTETSMFFNEDGTVAMHSGPKGSVILSDKLKNGKYSLAGNLLTLKWADNSLQKNEIRFVDKNTFRLTLTDKTSKKEKRQLIFRRVLDEEVVEEKPWD